MTGEALYKLLGSYPSGEPYDRARLFITNIYVEKLNDGIVPDHRIWRNLAEIVKDYLESNPNERGLPADILIVNALKVIPARTREQRKLWEALLSAAEAYFDQPSPENAEGFYLTLPEQRPTILDFEGWERVFISILDFTGTNHKGFAVLSNKMLEGEPYSIELAFRLARLSDGIDAEVLNHSIGQLVARYPRLFLQKLATHQSDTLAKWGNILNPLPWWETEQYKDETKLREAWEKEYNARKKALESVEDEDLRIIRDRCLSELERLRRY